jgi:hypothetical protein
VQLSGWGKRRVGASDIYKPWLGLLEKRRNASYHTVYWVLTRSRTMT